MFKLKIFNFLYILALIISLPITLQAMNNSDIESEEEQDKPILSGLITQQGWESTPSIETDANTKKMWFTGETEEGNEVYQCILDIPTNQITFQKIGKDTSPRKMSEAEKNWCRKRFLPYIINYKVLQEQQKTVKKAQVKSPIKTSPKKITTPEKPKLSNENISPNKKKIEKRKLNFDIEDIENENPSFKKVKGEK